ncbi:MAG TPA: TonB-dependent receptor [Polyangia bacterium]|nr:TonB-dependent receptor [Polyangia bacterium]
MSVSILAALLLAAAADAGPDAGAEDGLPSIEEGGADAGFSADASADLRVSPDAAPLAPTPVLSGRILARGTREPLVGAQVRVILDHGATRDTETDEHGSFSLTARPGPCQVIVHYPGFEPFSRKFDVSVSGTSDLVLRLEPRLTGDHYETVVTAAVARAPAIPVQREELTRTPGAFGDPFRVLESLPGVVQAIWPLPMYAIRGANPGNTGFFIDGVRAPALFHFALGPSVIHPFFLDQMQFYPGGYPVEYGRYVSGIVSARTAAPATDRLHVSADVRLFDAGGIAAAPFDNGRGTVAVAGRYSYTGVLLSAFSSEYSLDYWDYQLRVEHRLGPGRLTLFAFGSGDTLQQKHPDALQWSSGIQAGLAQLMFHRVQLRWDGGVLGGHVLASALVGLDDSTVSNTQLFDLPVRGRMMMAAPRLEMGWRLGPWVDLVVGGDAEAQRYRPQSLLAFLGGGLDNYYQTDLFRDRSVLSASGYLGMTIKAGDRLQVTPGFRYDLYFEQNTYEGASSPRLSLRYRVASETWLKGHVGQFSQMPSLPVGVPGFDGFGLQSFGLQRSRQGSVGVETGLGNRDGADLSLDTTVFYQRLHVTDVRNSLSLDPQARDFLEPREGESYGFEIMLRRPMRHRLYGWLSYTLSRSLRVVDGVIAPSDWDQRHVLNLVTGYRLPHGYAASARFHYNTGRPYPIYDPRFGWVNYQRIPAFPQLDLRGDKRFVFDRYLMDVYVEVVNATASREVFDEKLHTDGSFVQRAYRLVLPSIGVHVEW